MELKIDRNILSKSSTSKYVKKRNGHRFISSEVFENDYYFSAQFLFLNFKSMFRYVQFL